MIELDPLILCIESATKNCSAALFKGAECLSFKEESSDSYIHSEKLALFIDEILPSEIDAKRKLKAVAVSSGPGSYTGLRIGTALAKGICFSLGIPLISIDNLSQLAMAAYAMNLGFDYYIPMLDARRMEGYSAVFNSQGTQVVSTKATVIDSDSFKKYDGHRIGVCGDGAEKCLDVLGGRVQLIELECSARNMGKLALQKYLAEDSESLAYYEPFYLKEFVAGTPKKLL